MRPSRPRLPDRRTGEQRRSRGTHPRRGLPRPLCLAALYALIVLSIPGVHLAVPAIAADGAKPVGVTPPLAIERWYSARAGETLWLSNRWLAPAQDAADPGNAGHDRPVAATVGGRSTAGAARLATGDRLDIAFFGPEASRQAVSVDSAGYIQAGPLPPVEAANRTLDAVRSDLERLTETHRPGTGVHVALADRVAIRVSVVGEVRHPGRVTLAPGSLPYEALMASGGPRPGAALGGVRLVRNTERTRIDIEGWLTGTGSGEQRHLEDGDHLVVPRAEATIAVIGAVDRPAIFPIDPTSPPTIGEALDRAGVDLAGDPTILALLAGDDAASVVPRGLPDTPSSSSAPTGPRVPVSPEQAAWNGARARGLEAQVRDRMILIVRWRVPHGDRAIRIEGPVAEPGRHSLVDETHLSQLLNGAATPTDGAYPEFAVLERRDRGTGNLQGGTHYEVFSPREVLSGHWDDSLRPGDRVHLFPTDTIREMTEANAGAQQDPSHEPATVAAAAATRSGTPRLQTAFGQNTTPAETPVPAMQRSHHGESSSLPPAVLSRLIAENRITIRGGVAAPGRYPIAGQVRIERAIALAGGSTIHGLPGISRVTYPGPGTAGGLATGRRVDGWVTAGSSVSVPTRETTATPITVHVDGAVRNPGTYDLPRGSGLSRLLAEADGLAPRAYPIGARLTRDSLRRDAENARSALEKRIDSLIARTALSSGPNTDGAALGAALSDLSDLAGAANPEGRLVVEADPRILRANPEHDTPLEDGDRLHIPVRPSSVQVIGAVAAPGAFRYGPDLQPADYIESAGGIGMAGDRDGIYLLRPDGQAESAGLSWWNYQPAMVLPGTIIVVPPDLRLASERMDPPTMAAFLSDLAIATATVTTLMW